MSQINDTRHHQPSIDFFLQLSYVHSSAVFPIVADGSKELLCVETTSSRLPPSLAETHHCHQRLLPMMNLEVCAHAHGFQLCCDVNVSNGVLLKKPKIRIQKIGCQPNQMQT